MKKYVRINILKMSGNSIKERKEEDAVNFKIKMKRIFIDNNSIISFFNYNAILIMIKLYVRDIFR